MSTPWYRQFWPWFLLALPMSAVIACFITLSIFLDAQPDMVVDDYYKKGKAINFQKDKQDAALRLQLEAQLTLANEQLQLLFTSGRKNLDGSALTVNFYHTTQAEKDFSVKALQAGSGEFTAHIPPAIDGKWQLSIEPFDATWRLKKTVVLPSTTPYLLTPFSH